MLPGSNGGKGSYNEMNMRRPERMSVHQLQQLASWAVEWNGVGRWANAVECIFTPGVCVEFAAEVVVDL